MITEPAWSGSAHRCHRGGGLRHVGLGDQPTGRHGRGRGRRCGGGRRGGRALVGAADNGVTGEMDVVAGGAAATGCWLLVLVGGCGVGTPAPVLIGGACSVLPQAASSNDVAENRDDERPVRPRSARHAQAVMDWVDGSIPLSTRCPSWSLNR